MTLFRPGTSPPPVRMPIRRGLDMPAPGRVWCCARGTREGSRSRRAMVARAGSGCTMAGMNYELYMRAALSEAAAAAASGELADGAVAVVDEAMVANAR